MNDLERIKALTTNARTTWFTMLAALIFVGVTLMGVEHIDFYGVDRATQLPLINVSVPTDLFFYGAPLLIAAVYGYFHLYLIRLFDALGLAPAEIRIEVEGKPTRLGDAIPPWLVSEAALYIRRLLRRAKNPPETPCTKARPLDGLSFLVNVFFAWLFGPIVLGYAWVLSWPARTVEMSALAGTALVVSCLFGLFSFVQLIRSMRAPRPTPLYPSIAPHLYVPIAFLVVSLVVGHASWHKTSGEPARSNVNLHDMNWHHRWRHYLSNLDTLAPLILTNQQLTIRPDGWLNPLTAEAEYLGKWCDRAKADCQKLTDAQKSDFTLEWHDLRKGQLSELRNAQLNQLRSYEVEANAGISNERLIFATEDEIDSVLGGIERIALFAPDLRLVDLRGAFLPNLNLTAARMMGIKAAGANLEGTNLRFANLNAIHGERSDLREAILTRADLALAQLKEANLRKAHLQNANLRRARLQAVDLGFAQLQEADLRKAQLQGAILDEAQLQRAVLKDAYMQKATIWSTKLLKADLKYARLQEANLWGAQLQEADLRYAQLDGANFKEAQLQETDLSGAQLIGSDLSFSILTGLSDRMTMLETNLNAAINLGGAFRFVDLSRVNYDEKTDFRNIFLDASVILPDGFRVQMGGLCQIYPEVITDDTEFFGRWRGWFERQFNSEEWGSIGPPEWLDVKAIPPPEGCTWKTAPLSLSRD